MISLKKVRLKTIKAELKIRQQNLTLIQSRVKIRNKQKMRKLDSRK